MRRGMGVIAGSGGGGGGATRNGLDFVYRPGGVESGNVYTSLVTLNAAVAAARGARRILIDTTMGAAVWDATMDFGTEQGPVEVLGTPSVSAVTALTIATGANIRGVDTWTDLAITVTSTAAVMDGPVAGDILYAFRGKTSVICTGGAPLVKPTRVSGNTLAIVLEDDASFSNGGYAVAEVPNTYAIRCDVRDRATVGANTLKGSNRANFVSRHGSYATASATQVGGSSWSYQEFTAIGVSYDATLVAEGITAGSVQGAIDFLKQQVFRASDYVAADPGSALLGAARTAAARIRVNRAREATGIRIAWHCAVTTAVTCKLRTLAGALIASASVNVDVAGIYFIEFAAPVDLTPYLGQVLSISAYDGVDTWNAIDAGAHPTVPMAVDAAVTLIGYWYAVGDANPTTVASPEVYGVDLVTRGAS